MSHSPNDSHLVRVRKQIAREQSRIRAIDGGVCNAATDHTTLHILHTLPQWYVFIIRCNFQRRDCAGCHGLVAVARTRTFFFFYFLYLLVDTSQA